MRGLAAVAAILVLASAAGGGAWLYLTGHGRGGPDDHGTAVPRVTMSLNSYREAAPVDGAGLVDNASPVSDTETPRDAPSQGTQLAAAGLHPHPDPSLIQQSDLGPLPIIGKDGRTPWRVYSRPFSRVDTRPRVAVVITTLGVSENATTSAIESLPGEIALSFAPFTKNLADWIDKSRAAGHEVLIDLPMEPLDYPRSDPGPHTLLASVPIDQNLRQLGWILSRATGYVGVSIYMGSGLADKQRVLSPILEELKERGLMLVDTHENPLASAGDLARKVGLTVAVGDLLIDKKLAAKEIDAQLAAVEERARQNGAAVAIARPYPLSLKRLAAWAAGLGGRGIALAPVSAMPEPDKP